MISKTVTYTNYNNEQKTRTLWFHMSKQDILDNLDLQQQVEALQKIFDGKKRPISVLEITQILELIKRIVKITYGERSADGERFKKASVNPEVWDAFFETAAYDEFIESRFVPDPMLALEFLLDVMPAGLRAEAEAEVKAKQPEVYSEYESALSPQQKAESFDKAVRANIAEEEQMVFGQASKKTTDMTREELEAALEAIKNS
jgi:hypothetical protein